MKWDVTRWRRSQVVAGMMFMIAFAGVAYFLSWDSRTAMLSCGDCGNIRIIHVHTRWWRIESARVVDGNDFVVPADHEHRWWQYDSRRWDALRTIGWSRRKYEDGQIVWSHKIDHDNPEYKPEQRVEEWLNLYR